MAERSIAAVLKTVEGHTSGGSNPSLSAKALIKKRQKPVNSVMAGFFIFTPHQKNSKKVIRGVSDSVSGKNEAKNHSLDGHNRMKINLYQRQTSCQNRRAVLPLITAQNAH